VAMGESAGAGWPRATSGAHAPIARATRQKRPIHNAMCSIPFRPGGMTRAGRREAQPPHHHAISAKAEVPNCFARAYLSNGTAVTLLNGEPSAPTLCVDHTR
jgi:hypothetical protein